MHNWKISEYLLEVTRKLSKKDKSLYVRNARKIRIPEHPKVAQSADVSLQPPPRLFDEQLLGKIEEIKNCYNVEHYKNLRYNMKDSKRAHIGHFVLVFQYDKSTDTINFDDFDHHDNIYGKK